MGTEYGIFYSFLFGFFRMLSSPLAIVVFDICLVNGTLLFWSYPLESSIIVYLYLSLMGFFLGTVLFTLHQSANHK